MPPRNPELPEGTDQIITGAMDTGSSTGGLGGSTGSSGLGGSTGSSGLGGATGTSSGLGTSGTSTGTGSSGLGGTGGSDFGSSTGTSIGGGYSGSTGSGGDIKTQLRDGVSSIQQQAGDKVRSYAETGKTRATTALDDLSQVVSDAALSIDERLGSEFGEYARRAADAVTGLADGLRDRDVDQLFDDGRNLVRKSPGIALGAAAVVGFTLVRLIKSGMDDRDSRREREVGFTPDASLGQRDTLGETEVVVERETVVVTPSASPSTGI